ncbi:MAG: ribonuclease D, partial [Chloroflexota bacterium]
MTTQLPDYTYIEEAEQLRWLAVELSKAPMLALDTESNSMYAYEGEICLVQLSTREKDYIIDALAIDDLAPLGVLMEDPAIEKIFHAAEYDLMLFKRDYGFGI